MRIYAKRKEQFDLGPDKRNGVVLGQRLGGDRVLPAKDGQVIWGFDELRQPALVLGASGKGKTETLMQILYEVAVKTDRKIFYLDAKGDCETAERFVALMKKTGRRTRVFPNEPFDGWRGDWKAVVDRLLQVIAYEDTGPAAYYRDIAKTVLQTACQVDGVPPRSSRELLSRLSMNLLAVKSGGRVSAVLSEDLVSQIRMRYEAFFGQLGESLNGNWAWEDADAAYFLLDSVGREEDTTSTAAYAFADFAHYFKSRKPREQGCVLAVDEFSAVARTSDVASRLEQARGYNAFLLLAPQTVAGMGFPEQQSRILGSVDMVICHGMKEPGRIADLAGERPALELLQHYEAHRRTGEGQMRLEDRPRLTSDRLRELGPGEVWLIRNNRAMKVKVARPPEEFLELPERERVEVPFDPRQLSRRTAGNMSQVGKGAGDED
jgi:hypothetical protein